MIHQTKQTTDPPSIVPQYDFISMYQNALIADGNENAQLLNTILRQTVESEQKKDWQKRIDVSQVGLSLNLQTFSRHLLQGRIGAGVQFNSDEHLFENMNSTIISGELSQLDCNNLAEDDQPISAAFRKHINFKFNIIPIISETIREEIKQLNFEPRKKKVNIQPSIVFPNANGENDIFKDVLSIEIKDPIEMQLMKDGESIKFIITKGTDIHCQSIEYRPSERTRIQSTDITLTTNTDISGEYVEPKPNGNLTNTVTNTPFRLLTIQVDLNS